MTPSKIPHLTARIGLIRTLAEQDDPRLSISEICRRLEAEGVKVGRRVLGEFIADPANGIGRSEYAPRKPRSDATRMIEELIAVDRRAHRDGLARITNEEIAAAISAKLGVVVTRQQVQNRVHALNLRTSEETAIQIELRAAARRN